jgi:hypothetical protein
VVLRTLRWIKTQVSVLTDKVNIAGDAAEYASVLLGQVVHGEDSAIVEFGDK